MEPETQAPCKLLFIEDDTVDRIAFQRLVKNSELNYQYTVAKSATEAQKHLQTDQYDIVVTDFSLGDGTALDLLDFIKETPFIIITGAGDEETAVKVMKAGAFDYLIKDPLRHYLKLLPHTIQNALKQKHDRERLCLLESVVVNANDAVVITENEPLELTDYTIIYINESFSQITGYHQHELDGKAPDIFFGLNTNLDKVTELQKKLRKGQAAHAELIYYRKDGQEIWIDLNTKPIYSRLDKMTHWVSIMRDITERVQAEKKMIEAREIAENSLKVKERFLANMSHEIRTPMHAITGLSHLLSQTNPTPKQKEFIDAVKKSTDNLLVIINDLLDLAKIESGTIEINKSSFKLTEIFNALGNLLQPTIETKGNTLIIHIDKELKKVLVGDSARLHQILLNLLGNAIKFTENGEIRLSAKLLYSGVKKTTIVFSVVDTGIGLPEEKLSTIFGSFIQADKSIKRKYGGTGLGLTIAKQLIELQGGTISVESQLGVGTTFRFTLCFEINQTNDPSLKTHKEEVVPPPNFAHLKILAVEDNDMNQFMVMSLLEKTQAKVVIVANGHDALAVMQKESFDLVLMDLHLPDIDGYEVTKLVRTKFEEPIKSIPIMAMTATILSEVKEKAFAAGLDDYILKPFIPEQLYIQIEKLLNKHIPQTETSAPEVNHSDVNTNGYDIDLTYLYDISGGNEQVVIKMLRMFIQQVPDIINSMQQYCEDKNWHALKDELHKITSPINYVGIKRLGAITVKVRDYIADPSQIHLIPAAIKDMEQIYQKAHKELEAELEKLGR